MAEREKIGILFGYSEGWIGGSYYFINLIHAFQKLKDELKPHIIIVTDDENSYKKIQETGYSYLSRLSGRFKYSITERIINKASRIILGRDIIMKGYESSELPVLFGYYEQLHTIKCKRKLYWIPDLQDKHYPEYLGNVVAKNREKQHKAVAYSKAEIVFSSKDAEKDFKYFYPALFCKTYVVPFAVTLPLLNDIDAGDVLQKFGLMGEYFIVPNQFWSHKNHLTAIKAVEFLKKNKKEVILVFTGNETTDQGTYARDLKEYVHQKKLDKNIRFLGFIDRKEQLILMRESLAVLQPSLFEGWSTVIEDAKALNKFIIASDLMVHHEQLKDGITFFAPLNFEVLAALMTKQISERILVHINYEENIVQYATLFLQIINNAA